MELSESLEHNMHFDDLGIAVMAGGKSTRMGTDKAFVTLQSRPLIEIVLGNLAGFSDENFIVTNDPEPFAYLGLPTVKDIFQECGPLAGLHAALSKTVRKHLLVVACDMPWLDRSLLQYMISLRHEADIIVPRWDKYPEPLHAVYAKSCLTPVENALRKGERKVVSFYGQVSRRFLNRTEIARLDPAGRSFANLNTPEDLEEAHN